MCSTPVMFGQVSTGVTLNLNRIIFGCQEEQINKVLSILSNCPTDQRHQTPTCPARDPRGSADAVIHRPLNSGASCWPPKNHPLLLFGSSGVRNQCAFLRGTRGTEAIKAGPRVTRTQSATDYGRVNLP